MSQSYADDAPPMASSGFALVAVGSVVAAILLILAFAYYQGHSARIASLYTSLAAPANQALPAEVNAYNRDQRTNLAAAKKDLTRLVNTDNSFDASIVAITLPHAASDAAAALVQADLKREKLFRQQEKSTTLRQLRSFNRRDQSANAAVAAQVQQIRQALGLPPASAALF